MKLLRDAVKPFLVLATIVCFLSIGGAMAVAVWVLVPLHWWVSRASGPYATGGWAVLAGISVAEASAMYAWILTRNGVVAIGVALSALAATLVLFLRGASARASYWPRRQAPLAGGSSSMP